MADLFMVNAFECGPFTGNPAAVVPLEEWLSDDHMQAIAAQINLSETAFFCGGEEPRLRWFTPIREVDLCGHATLATAHVIFSELGDRRDSVSFRTASGPLGSSRRDGEYVLDFPELRPDDEPVGENLRRRVLRAAGVEDGAVHRVGESCILVLDSAATIAGLRPLLPLVEGLPGGDLLVTAPGTGGYDIVSRVFAPGVGIPEDPVTGSAHCALVPYWAKRLGRETLVCLQASARGGVLKCSWNPAQGRVALAGSCATYLRGQIEL